MFINSLYLLLIAVVQCCFGFEMPHVEFEPLNRWESMEPIKEMIDFQVPDLETYKFGDNEEMKNLEKSNDELFKLIRENKDSTRNFYSLYIPHSVNDTLSDILNALHPSQTKLSDKDKDEMERIENELELLANLTKNNDTERSKRSAVTSTSSTVPIYSHYSSKLAELENNIRQMTENIVKLKKSASLTNEDEELFSTLEERVTNLNNLIGNQSIGSDEEIRKVKSTIESLSNSMSSLNTEFLALKQKIAEQEEKTLGTVRCIKDIQSHNFEAADAKLSSIEDESKINFIVHQVYSNEEAHFNLVLEFGERITNVKRRYLLYKALNYEMERNMHRDPFKLIKLIKSLRRKIIKNRNIANVYGTKVEAKSLVSNIVSTLKMTVKDKLKEGMLHERYDSVANLAEATASVDYEMFHNLITEIVNELYGNVSTEQLISSIPTEPSYTASFFALPAYSALLDKMQSHGEFSTHAIFKIAYRIKSLRKKDPNYLTLEDRLPESVRNAVFAPRVCIKNVLRNEYLYSAHTQGEIYNDRGGVFTSNLGYKVPEADWLLEPEGEHFYIKNYMRNEYLYSARPFGHKSHLDKGLVSFWLTGNKLPEGKWKIEPNGDNCYIKNAKRNEYLYSDRVLGQNYDKNGGSVYTWIPGDKVSAAEWKIEDCS